MVEKYVKHHYWTVIVIKAKVVKQSGELWVMIETKKLTDEMAIGSSCSSYIVIAVI